MPKKFRGKYRTTSIRKPGWDYGSNAAYFVTICTKNRKKYFGELINNEMKKSEIGQLTHDFWTKIPNHFSFVELGEFIVMPEHFHGIVVIKNPSEAPNLGASTIEKYGRDFQPWKSGNLGVIINQFKRICTINARKIDPEFAWQSRYHDHIIRDHFEFNRISEYIRKNPEKG